jgi:hypothetical protein
MSMRERVAPVLALLTHKSVVIAACAAVAMILGAMSVGTLMIFHKKMPLGILQTHNSPPDPVRTGQKKTTPAASQGVVAGAETTAGQPPTSRSPAGSGAVSSTGQTSTNPSNGAAPGVAPPSARISNNLPAPAAGLSYLPSLPSAPVTPSQSPGQSLIAPAVGQLTSPLSNLLTVDADTEALNLQLHIGL